MPNLLKDYFTLSHKVAVYVPSTTNVDESIDDSQFKHRINATSRILSQLFGGATASEALGYFVASNGELVTERIAIVYAFASNDDLKGEGLKRLLNHCSEMALKYKQESILLEIDKKAIFVNSNKKGGE